MSVWHVVNVPMHYLPPRLQEDLIKMLGAPKERCIYYVIPGTH